MDMLLTIDCAVCLNGRRARTPGSQATAPFRGGEMSVIKSIKSFINTDQLSQTVALEINDASLLRPYLERELLAEIVQRVAEKYVETHGDAILASINAKTIDAKVIAKVVENLRKELRR
jgi:hypothetical protein